MILSYLLSTTKTSIMKYIFCTALVFLLLIGCSQTGAAESESALAKAEAALATAEAAIAEAKVAIAEAKSVMAKATAEKWTPLFDGESLAGWSVPVYGGDGEVDVQEGNIVIGRGEQMTGIRYEKEFPKVDYEIRYEARRTGGYDFFAACTFPVNESFCTFINGGWGGGTVGLSSINGCDASENETSTYFDFKDNTWYRFRMQVTADRIQIGITPHDKEGNWLTENSLVDLEVSDDTRCSTRMEVDQYKPLGFCTWSTEGQLRNIEYRTGVRGLTPSAR